MGLTPLEGLVMGTRSGDIDPAIMEFIAKKENLDIDGVMNVLNKKSGVEGLSGVSSDFRDLKLLIMKEIHAPLMPVRYLLTVWQKYIGAYVAAMNGVDAIAFTAGIGENTSFIREKSFLIWDIWESSLIRRQTMCVAWRKLFPHRIQKLPYVSFRPTRSLQSVVRP